MINRNPILRSVSFCLSAALLLAVATSVGALAAPPTKKAPQASIPSLSINFLQPTVLTQHNDRQRTGANLQERSLNPQNVPNLKLKYTAHLAGQIVGQPLYVPDVPFKRCKFNAVTHKPVCTTKRHDAIFVVTQANRVYALDANATDESHAVIRFHQLPYQPARGNSGTTPFWGVASTPVIDRFRHIMYVVAKEGVTNDPDEKKANGIAFHVHALSLSTLKDVDIVNFPPAQIATGFQVPTLGSLSGNPGTVMFEAFAQNQRPGLLLAPDFAGVKRLYIAFGGQPNDFPFFRGYIFAFSENLDYLTSVTTNDSAHDIKLRGGGVWQGGGGLSDDGTGNFYFATGNVGFGAGAPTSDPTRLGNAIVKLRYNPPNIGTPRFDPPEFFIPPNSLALNLEDMDIASTGILMLPRTFQTEPGTSVTQLWPLGSGKDGIMRFFNPSNMTNLFQTFQATFNGHLSGCMPELCTLKDTRARDFYPHVHGTPVYWKTSSGKFGEQIYVWAEKDFPRAYKYSSASGFDIVPNPNLFAQCGGKCKDLNDPTKFTCDPPTPNECLLDGGSVAIGLAIGTKLESPSQGLLASKGMAGAMLSLSANGDLASSGVLWAATHSNFPDGDSESYFEPGILRAFKADPEAATVFNPVAGNQIANFRLREIWNNATIAGQEKYYFAKFVAPTVVDGHVILAGTKVPQDVCDTNFPAHCHLVKEAWVSKSPTDVTGVLMVFGL